MNRHLAKHPQDHIFSKTTLRKMAREKRKAIPTERRLPAAQRLIEILLPRLQEPTLSFASFGDEIDLCPLNEILCKRQLLVLPGQDHALLSIFGIENLADLEKPRKENRFPKDLLVPNEGLCKQFPLSQLAFVLVPALTFDKNGGRIGYGGGFYDRLLAQLSPKTRKIGVGFIEQLFSEDLPHESHDIYVDELVLV